VKTSHSISTQLADAAYELRAAVERSLNDVLAKLDLTLPLADALWQMDPVLGPLSRGELAERLRCDPSNVSFLVGRLERRQLVTRARARGDQRVTTLQLTPAGARARARLVAAIAESSLFAGLARSEQQQLAGLLARCFDA
jgi:DNA-binding MarR family transcriptional regulator